ncbi:HD-GYP domain-containing protein [Pseudothermotoga sp.]|uniref:HD-GYP domain-containing protein n=1 Tax=Pseudothermotoga sp. TaxID=2033661 RepID=UPI0031F61182
MSLSEMVKRFKRYGLILMIILVATFMIGLFPLAQRISVYYSTTYAKQLKNFVNELIQRVSGQSQPALGIVVKRLTKNFIDVSTGVDLSGLLVYEDLPGLSRNPKGLFTYGSSAKFLLVDEPHILLIEIPSSLFERILSAEMAYVFLASSDGTIVVSNNMNLLGSKIHPKKGFSEIGSSVGYMQVEPIEPFKAFVCSFIPLNTYLVVLLPYFLVFIAALCGAAIWLTLAYSFENRFMTAMNLALENVNQSLSKLDKTEEVVYVPIETEITELNQLQNGIQRLIEAQKASWHELHAMTNNLQDTVNELEETQKVLQERNTQIIATLAEAIEIKDANTFGHSDHVVTLALDLAKELGLTDPADLEAIRFGALLHDIGKIGIPEHILNKPGRLTQDEYEIMKMHPIYGEKIVRKISGWDLVADIIRHHHENFDGSGYPDGLKGTQISLRTQIVGLVDVFSALIEDRPYRRALSVEEALRLMENEMVGTKFDPKLYEAFLRVLQRYIRRSSTRV